MINMYISTDLKRVEAKYGKESEEYNLSQQLKVADDVLKLKNEKSVILNIIPLENFLKVNSKYLKIVEAEDYSNDRTIDIYTLTSDLLHWHTLCGTEADILAFGEFTRRYNLDSEKLINDFPEIIEECLK